MSIHSQERKWYLQSSRSSRELWQSKYRKLYFAKIHSEHWVLFYLPSSLLSLSFYFLNFFIFSSSMSHMSSLSLRIHHVLTCGCWRGLSTMGKPSPPGSILHVSSYVNALKTFSYELVHFLCCESNIESSWLWCQLESITQLSFKSRKRAGLQNAF